MIDSKKRLREYLDADREALNIKAKFPPLVGKEVWKFQIALRYYEYYLNCKGKGVRYIYWKLLHHYYEVTNYK